MSVRVLLVDDHTVVREGLKALVDGELGLEVVGQAADGRAGVRLARELTPNVVVMDVVLPELNGIEATRQIRAELPETRVIALSMHSDRRYVVEMLRAGASGYLLKDCAFEELARALRTVAGGNHYLGRGVTDVVVAAAVGRGEGAGASPFDELTAREREVLQLVAEGDATRVIAAKLSVSIKTVESHRHRIMRKLGLHSVAELTRYAVREGLVSLD